MSDTPWVIVDFNDGRWKCQRCGESTSGPDLPLKVDTYAKMMNGFADAHAACKEPVTNGI